MEAKSAKQNYKAESAELEKSNFGLSVLSHNLKIGYDGKRATNNLTGLGNYSRSLIGHLSKQFSKNTYFIYTPRIKWAIENLPLYAQPNIRLELPNEGKLKLFWRTFSIKSQLKKDKINLFHGLSHEIPVGLKSIGIKSVVTIHDLIFLRYPAHYNYIDRLIYRLKSKYACKNANRIIAISEQTKKDIVEFYLTDPAKIDVIYQSCDDSFKMSSSSEDKDRIRKQYQLPNQYLLNVGTIETRKNLMLIVKALPKIDPNYPIVVIGKETAYTKLVKEKIVELGLENRLIFLKNIPFSDLPTIYQMATLFIYASLYEGFGIPIIEALYSNVPVIAATGSCLEEAGGPNSIYVSPTDDNALAATVNMLLNDQDLQQKMQTKGLEYVQRFNSNVIGKQVMDCYSKTLGL